MHRLNILLAIQSQRMRLFRSPSHQSGGRRNEMDQRPPPTQSDDVAHYELSVPSLLALTKLSRSSASEEPLTGSSAVWSRGQWAVEMFHETNAENSNTLCCGDMNETSKLHNTRYSICPILLLLSAHEASSSSRFLYSIFKLNLEHSNSHNAVHLRIPHRRPWHHGRSCCRPRLERR